jgi:rhodanese-related sulfurtransferase
MILRHLLWAGLASATLCRYTSQLSASVQIQEWQQCQAVETATHCNAGNSVNAAQNILLNHGFKSVSNISGGYKKLEYAQWPK